MDFVNDVEPVGSEPAGAIADYLELLNDSAAARLFRSSGPGGQSMPFVGDVAWTATGFRIGFIAPQAPGGTGDIVPASALTADETLVGTRIKLTLDAFYARALPGLGEHTVLFEFGGRNQCGNDREDVGFTTSFKVRDRSSAAVNGSPIFVGLTVDPDGMALKGRLICIGSSGDEWLLNAVQSDAFRGGLALVSHMQPVLKPFLSLAGQAVGAALAKNRNKLILKFDIGLDFSGTMTSAKMQRGSYVIVQTDAPEWNWDEWTYRQSSQTVVDRVRGTPPESNYFILGVSEAHAEHVAAAGNVGEVPQRRAPKERAGSLETARAAGQPNKARR